MARRRKREYPLPHYGQIITTRHAIRDYLWSIDGDIGYNTAVLIALGRDHPDYMLRLYSICSKLCFLSKLIYRCKDGYKVWDKETGKKMLEEYGDDITREDIREYLKNRKGFSKLPDRYYDDVFTNCLEYEEEAEDRLREYNKEHGGKIEITPELTAKIIRCKKIIAAICSRLMKTIDEQFFIGNYAYVYDYVIRHNGDLPMPEYKEVEYRMDRIEPFFPCNYEDFNITEGMEGKFEELDTNMYWM